MRSARVRPTASRPAWSTSASLPRGRRVVRCGGPRWASRPCCSRRLTSTCNRPTPAPSPRSGERSDRGPRGLVTALAASVASRPARIDALQRRAARRFTGGLGAAPTAFEDWPRQRRVVPDHPAFACSTRPAPDTECPFYRGAYQNFLIATSPTPRVDLRSSTTRRRRRVRERTPMRRATPPDERGWDGAPGGYRNVLIDQDGHTLYYGLHMNQAFVNFIRRTTPDRERDLNVDATLAFPGARRAQDRVEGHRSRRFPGGKVPPPGGYPAIRGLFELHHDDAGSLTSARIRRPAPRGDPDHPSPHPGGARRRACRLHASRTPGVRLGTIQHVNLARPTRRLCVQGVTVIGAPDDQPDPSHAGRRLTRRRPRRSREPGRHDRVSPTGFSSTRRDTGEPGEPAVHEPGAGVRRGQSIVPGPADVDLPACSGVQVPAGGPDTASSRSTPT